MSLLSNIYQKALGAIQNTFNKPELINPIPEVPQITPEQAFAKENNITIHSGSPSMEQLVAFANRDKQPEQGQVMGTTTTNSGRNPNWDYWQKTNPKRFDELLAGARQASENTGVPVDMLMDISGAETSGGQILTQKLPNGQPVPNGGRGYFQFEEPTLRGLGSDIDPYSATESAQLAAELIKSGQLSRWGIPREQAMEQYGKYWGTLDNPNNNNGSLIDFYSPDELNPYLAEDFQVR